MTSRLTLSLRAQTRQLHTQLERSGVMQALLRGRIDRPAYCALLRNLHAIYAALEPGLKRHRTHPCIVPATLAGLERAGALAQDLCELHGPQWESEIPLLPAAQRYRQRLQELDRSCPECLVAHAYVRYLGDLSGGQILRGIVAESLGLEASLGTHFYEFGAPGTAADLAQRFRAGLDAIALDTDGVAALVAEAQRGFLMHQELFEQLARPRAAVACR